MSQTFTPGRRALLRGGAALGAVGALSAVSATPSQAATVTRKPVLVGANPGIQHYDAAGACTAYASVWRVDWSTHGSGAVPHPLHGRWCDDSRRTEPSWPSGCGRTTRSTSVRSANCPDPCPLLMHRRQPVKIDLDLATGLVARAGDIVVRMNGVLDRRWVDVAEFELGHRVESLNFVVGPCADGSISQAGRRLPGAVVNYNNPDKPWTSAYLSQAEVWRA